MSSTIEDLLQPDSIGETLFLLRRKTSLQRAELAERAEVEASTLTRMENGTTRNGTYDLSTIWRILRVLGAELGIDERTLWEAIREVLERQDRARFSLAAQAGAVNARTKRRRSSDK